MTLNKAMCTLTQQSGYQLSSPSRKAVLTLHIGAHRTATSTFQELVSDRTYQTDAYYPDTGRWSIDASHNGLGLQFWGTGSDDDHHALLASLQDEIAGRIHVLISSEVLEKVPLHGDRDRLAVFLVAMERVGFGVRVLYTVRRQDCMVDAIFKQWISSSDYQYHGSALRLAEEQIADLDYRRVIEAWLPLVESVAIVPYQERDARATMAGLFAAAGIEVDLDRRPIPHAHPSIEGDALRFKHALNRHRPRPELNDRINDALRHLPDMQSRRQSSVFSRSGRLDYIDRFADCNRDIACFARQNTPFWNPHHLTPKDRFFPATAKVVKDVLSCVRKVDDRLAHEVASLLV